MLFLLFAITLIANGNIVVGMKPPLIRTVADCSPSNPCGECEGHCQKDEDCGSGMICYYKGGKGVPGVDSVPGCSGSDVSKTDWCIKGDRALVPHYHIPLIHPIKKHCSEEDPCERCQGHCFADNDCADNLICYFRDAGEPVPGCIGSDLSKTDWCVIGSRDANEEIPLVKPVKHYCTEQEPCDRCQGHCYDDTGCKDDMVCYHKDEGIEGNDDVPGCLGHDLSQTDWCTTQSAIDSFIASQTETVVPTTKPTTQELSSPTPLPTVNAPSLRPTDAPTLAPISVSSSPTMFPKSSTLPSVPPSLSFLPSISQRPNTIHTDHPSISDVPSHAVDDNNSYYNKDDADYYYFHKKYDFDYYYVEDDEESSEPSPISSILPTISRSPTPKPTFGTPTASPMPTAPSATPTEPPAPRSSPSAVPINFLSSNPSFLPSNQPTDLSPPTAPPTNIPNDASNPSSIPFSEVPSQVTLAPSTASPTLPTSPPTTQPPSPSPAGNSLPTWMVAMLNRVNAERSNNGVEPPLCYVQSLIDAAGQHNNDMVNNNYFSHTGSDSSAPWDRMASNGYQWSSAAENIAMGQTSVIQVMSAWMNSPGHRANILNQNVDHFGAAWDLSSNKWTQVFGASFVSQNCVVITPTTSIPPAPTRTLSSIPSTPPLIPLPGPSPTSAPVTLAPVSSAPVALVPVPSAPIGPTDAPVDPTLAPVDPTSAPVAPFLAPVSTAPMSNTPVVPDAPIDPTNAPVVPPTDAPAPLTPIPVSSAPVTTALVTPAPVTLAPLTPTPVSLAPVTPSPLTPAPVSPAPVSPAPIDPTDAPVDPTLAPVDPTSAPVAPSLAPVSTAPMSNAPVVPLTDAPIDPTNAPVVLPTDDPAPLTPTPVSLAPVTPSPVTPSPLTPAPVSSAPVTPAPVTPAPIDPTGAPDDPTLAPVDPTSAPVAPSLAPVSTAPISNAPVVPLTDAPIDPTNAPVDPTNAPVVPPTDAPIDPTNAPVTPTLAPIDPTVAPAVDPTNAPIVLPTDAPVTVDPTAAPTLDPTNAPVVSPTDAPIDPVSAPINLTLAPIDPTNAPVLPPTSPAPKPVPTLSPTRCEETSVTSEQFYSGQDFTISLGNLQAASSDVMVTVSYVGDLSPNQGTFEFISVLHNSTQVVALNDDDTSDCEYVQGDECCTLVDDFVLAPADFSTNLYFEVNFDVDFSDFVHTTSCEDKFTITLVYDTCV